MSPPALPYGLAGGRSTARGHSPLPTNQNKKLEAIPWDHHSPVLASRFGPRAVTTPASTSPHHSRSRARTRSSAFHPSRRPAPGAASA
jgi:hypothetical protein